MVHVLGRLLSGVRRLKGRTPHELYTRAAQAGYALSERAALGLPRQRAGARQPSLAPGVSPERLPLPGRQPFFSGLADRQATLDALRIAAPDHATATLLRAEEVARGRVPIFGHGLVQVGSPPVWNHDPFANRSAPDAHWSRVPYLDASIVGDHKVVWEISRHQYFVTLGQAWLYSGNRRWPALFVEHVQSWIEKNPVTVGMNWASSLEVSFRAMSWLWALELMRDAPGLEEALGPIMLGALEAHGRHLERYLSTYFSPNTHLTGEALGLFYIGTSCPELRDAARWRALGAGILESSLSRQVRPDGTYFEQATLYHRYTVEIYLHYLLLARATGHAVGGTVEPALHRLFDVLLALTRADGTIPLVGDDDGGRLVQLDTRPPHDVRALLAIGAVVLQRSDLAWAGRGDDAALCWLLGGSAPAERDGLLAGPPAASAAAFHDGGLYTMRDGWGSGDGHAAIDGGPHGALSFGHSHADALSVELSVGGRPLFVDAGTYTYVGAERNTFRATSAHNTVEVDGESTSIPGASFQWKQVAHPRATCWVDDAAFTYFAGAHDAYHRLSSPVRHERSVLHPARGLWVVRDDVLPAVARDAGRHELALRWHCAPGLRARVAARADNAAPQGPAFVQIDEGGVARAELAVCGAAGSATRVEEGWVSRQYGEKCPAAVCVTRLGANGHATLLSVIVDASCYRFATEPDITHHVTGARHALRLQGVEAREKEGVLLVGNGERMVFDALEVDAGMVWIELEPRTGAPASVTAIGVTSLSYAGAPLPLGTAAPSWAVATAPRAGTRGAWTLRAGPLVSLA